MIYFIQQEPGGAIKIGYAKNNIQERIATFQTASPYKLVLIKSMEGSPATEAALHREFKDDLIRNEWFNPSSKLMEFINSPWFISIPKKRKRRPNPPRSVKTKIINLIKRFGNRKKLAEALEVNCSYIYKLEHGHRPGSWLYRQICRIYDNDI